jgi:hypothetical protein
MGSLVEAQGEARLYDGKNHKISLDLWHRPKEYLHTKVRINSFLQGVP